MPKDPKDKDADDVFWRIQLELKKSSDQAAKRKKELDVKLDELKAEEARQNALWFLNRANRGRELGFVTRLGLPTHKPKKPGKAKESDPRGVNLHSLLLVDPKLTSKPKDDGLSKQVSDLEKRLARMEKLLEKSLAIQQEADRREAEVRHSRNREKEMDAKIRELKRAEAGKAKKDNDDSDNTDPDRKHGEKKLKVRRRW